MILRNPHLVGSNSGLRTARQVAALITATQLRAARSLLGIGQRRLAELCGLSVPTIQRMEASDGVVRGSVDSLVKVVGALEDAGIEMIGEGAASPGGGRGVRLRAADKKTEGRAGR